MNLLDYITVVKDFPKEGVMFQDITSLLENGPAYKEAIRQMVEIASELKPDIIVGPESRGFMFACPVAAVMGKPFVPVRKKGKLPRETISYTYDLEYGQDTLYMHKDAVKAGQKVLVVDDIVAIGGTLDAVANLVKQNGGEVVGMVALMGLSTLPGMKRLEKYNLKCLLEVEVDE